MTTRRQRPETMVLITEDLIRRRAEHNDCQLFCLEEVSLHQQDIERIQHIDRWCRELRILYLQNNLIPKIENVGRLKKLQYLNLALNNIEVIENLEGCESLEKLDLTLNFVGQLSSVESLRHNAHLRELFLVGNPCTQFQGYRSFVATALPQLQSLDGTEISRSERIAAGQEEEAVRRRVEEQEREHLRKRAKEKEEAEETGEGSGAAVASVENRENVPDADEEQQQEHDYWNTPCSFTPESRLEMHRHLQEKRRSKETETEEKPKPKVFFTAEGKVLNMNEARLNFCLSEDEDENAVVLDLAVYRHLDTSLIEADVQPTYVRVTIKGKIFQLVLPAEVRPDRSTARRSQITGHLVLTMPRADGEIRAPAARPGRTRPSSCPKENKKRNGDVPERLEVDPGASSSVDISNIVPRRAAAEAAAAAETHRKSRPTSPPRPSEAFVDDPDVPPLV